MFDADDHHKAKRPRSLLSLSAAKHADGGPGAQVEAAADEDAAGRHRLARKGAERVHTPPEVPEPAVIHERRNAGGLVARLRKLAAGGGSKPAREDPHPTAAHALPPAAPTPVAPSPARAGPAEGDDRDQYWRPLIDPLHVLAGVGSSRRLIATATLAGALIGLAIALTTPKKYEATAELLVDPRELKIVERDLTATGLPSDGTLAIVENQVRVLVSGNVLTKVVDQLNLAADPEFNGKGGGFSIRGLISELRSILTRSDDGGDVRRALAINNLAGKIDAERSEKTFVISVTVSTRDGDKSALIANTLTDVFLQTYGQIQASTAGRATDELTARLAELQAGVEGAERTVEAFKAENDIIDAQGRLITDDEIVKLNDQLSSARAHTIDLNARAASAKTLDLGDVLAGTLPEHAASPVMTALRTQYSTLKQEVDRLGVRLGPRHPQRLAADAQLNGARDQLQVELRRITQSLQVDLQRAVRLEQDLAARLAQLKAGQAGLNEEMVTLRELERDASSKRSVYEAYLLRARETGEQQSLNTANVSVISQATSPLTASGTSRSMTVIMATFLGFLAGIGLGGARGAVASLRESGRTASRNEGRRLARRPHPPAQALPGHPAPEPQPVEPPVRPIEQHDAHVRQEPSHPRMQTSLYPRAVAERDPRLYRQSPPPSRALPPLFDAGEWPAMAHRHEPRPIDGIRENLREVREAVHHLAARRSAGHYD